MQKAMLLGKVIVSLLCLEQTNDCDGNVKEKIPRVPASSYA